MPYQYCSIEFGFVASPFILNYIIKEHVAKFPQALCQDALSNNLYVYNLVVSDNCPERLLELHLSADDIMKKREVPSKRMEF